MTYTWKNILFHLWLPLRCYLPWLDHIKIISNHHAATCVLSTRSVGKFAEKLISCQGHFHYRGWLSLQGCYPVPVTLSTNSREYFQVFMSLTKNSLGKNSVVLRFQTPQQWLGHGLNNYRSQHGHASLDYYSPLSSSRPGPNISRPCERQKVGPTGIESSLLAVPVW